MTDYFGYHGKKCIVTGAASGMGKATAEMLIDLGAKVYAIDYAEVELPGAEKVITCNLAKREEIDSAFSKLPNEISSFFGVAGVSGQYHDYNTVMKINFVANKYIMETYLPKMVKTGGSIVFVSSLAALWWENNTDDAKRFFEVEGWNGTVKVVEDLDLNDHPGTDAYFISKRAVNYLVCASVPKFSAKKIRINATMPGAAKTGLTKDFADMMGGEQNLVIGFSDRPATSEEMAAPLVFLNSKMADYINGICLNIDAGESSSQMIHTKPREYDFAIFSDTTK